VQNWDDDVWPPVVAHYRNDPQNVCLDGNSNLVLRATKEGDDYFSGKLRGNWRGLIGHTWEARIKLNCLISGLWPSFWVVNEDPVPDGEVDVFEWYGNGAWPPGTTVHAASRPKHEHGSPLPPGPRFGNTPAFSVPNDMGFQLFERWQFNLVQVIRAGRTSPT
jgi:glycosyl hydrolase family 16